MKFKVGDRVRVCHTSNVDSVSVGECGTIVGIDTGHYAVRFDKCNSTGRHNCDGYCGDGYGWWCDDDMLEPADAENKFGKIPSLLFPNVEYVFNAEEAQKIYDEIFRHFNAFPKEDKSMKLTFSTTEGYRIDTSNNTKIPTITTKVTCQSYDSTYHGSATCDKFNYDERQGVLEAIANAMFGSKFDREYNRAVKANKEYEKATRICDYCGRVFDTVEERKAHEDWHIERRKARHERYLLRKRAKEIAFEEQAQKMAKEMLEEQK